MGGWSTLRDVLLDRASAYPDKLAFAHRERELTFSELTERADARAAALEAAGVSRGDRVAVAMPAGLELVEVFWALQLLGAAPCIINPSVPAETLERRVSLVRPRLVVTSETARTRDSASRSRERDLAPNDLAFLQLTSGTSGEPRASMILHRNVISYLGRSRSNQTLTPDDVLVCWVPPWHDLGLVRFLIGSVFGATSCHLVDPSVRTIPEWLALISSVRATYSAAPDFACRLAVRMVDPDRVDLSSMRFLKSGGEPVRWSTVERFEEHFGVTGVIIPGYGLGEATVGVSEHVPGDRIPVDERGNVSCGPVHERLEVNAGESLDEPKEILVRGETVFAGYFDAPQETAHALRDGWLHTGDTGYLDADGNLFVLGRREGMIKRAGSVVAPRELEEAAQRVEGVRVAAAVSVPAVGERDDEIVLVVEADLGMDPGEADARQELAVGVTRAVVATAGFAPTRVAIVPRRAIPRTENGKVRHGELQKLLEQGASKTPVD